MTVSREEAQRAAEKVRRQQREQAEAKPNGQTQVADVGAIRAHYWTLDDIKNLAPPEWIITGLLPRRAKALIFGESGTYKTMYAVDGFCRVAHGMDYHGLEIGTSFPVCFLANEDAYGLAVQRVQGWHLFYGKPSGCVIVLPGNTRLDRPEDIARALACAKDAFGDERPIFVIDTWDRSISGNPNSTEDVNPALSGIEALLANGEAAVTITHSPWSDTNRTKGSVTFWANHDTRIKVEKDAASGQGSLEVIHHKNARAGLELAFDFEQFEFEHQGVPTNTLIPQRDFAHEPGVDRGQPKRQKLRPNEKTVLEALQAAIADAPEEPPVAKDIPSHAKGVSSIAWETSAMRYLTQSDDFRKREAFKRAKASLVALGRARYVLDFAWLP